MFYQLLIKLNSDKKLKIGALGKFNFPRGYYVYSGSAKRNFSKRIYRHIKKKKKYKWHIDYLLKAGKIIQIKKLSDLWDECNIHKSTLRFYDGKELIEGFGSSDCNCKSHLIFLGKNLKLLK